MKILMATRRSGITTPGGDTIQIQSVARELEKLGHKVVIDFDGKVSAASFDIVHIFNLDRPQDVIRVTSEAKKTRKPVVLTPIFVDYREFDVRGRMGVRKWSYVMKLAEQDNLSDHLIGHGFGFAISADTPLESADGKTYDVLSNFHSLWLFLSAKTGVLGMGAFFWFLVVIWRQYEKTKDRDVLSLLLLFSIFLDFSFAGSVTGLFTQSYLYPFLLGL